MLALISPAKKLDFKSDWSIENTTQPHFLEQTQILVDNLKGFSKSNLQNLMKLSENLTDLNYSRYKRFSLPLTSDNARPAITAFRGDTYVGLDGDTLSNEELNYAQQHLRILSGLYGLLRPLDLMQAYRLEMGTKLTNQKGEDLYNFWEDQLTQSCNKAVQSHKDKTIISLASNEYIKSIKPKNLNGPFLTCHFKELKNGAPKTIGLFAKRARGAMARFIIQNRIEKASDLTNFQEDGYKFINTLSDDRNYTFLRENG